MARKKMNTKPIHECDFVNGRCQTCGLTKESNECEKEDNQEIILIRQINKRLDDVQNDLTDIKSELESIDKTLVVIWVVILFSIIF